MSHRYPTRFQAKATQTNTSQPIAAQAVDAPQENATDPMNAIQDDAKQKEESVAYIRSILNRINESTPENLRIELELKMFEYLYDHPYLLLRKPHFRLAFWNKMNEFDEKLIERLHSPSLRLISNEPGLRQLRTNIIRLLDAMNRVRERYYFTD